MLPAPVTVRELASAGVATLAALAHDAEDAADDVTFLAIQDEAERRPAAEREAYRLAWIDEGRRRYAGRRAL